MHLRNLFPGYDTADEPPLGGVSVSDFFLDRGLSFAFADCELFLATARA